MINHLAPAHVACMHHRLSHHILRVTQGDITLWRKLHRVLTRGATVLASRSEPTASSVDATARWWRAGCADVVHCQMYTWGAADKEISLRTSSLVLPSSKQRPASCALHQGCLCRAPSELDSPNALSLGPHCLVSPEPWRPDPRSRPAVAASEDAWACCGAAARHWPAQVCGYGLWVVCHWIMCDAVCELPNFPRLRMAARWCTAMSSSPARSRTRCMQPSFHTPCALVAFSPLSFSLRGFDNKGKVWTWGLRAAFLDFQGPPSTLS